VANSGFGLQFPVGLKGIKVSAWLADGDPASRDPVDAHVGDAGEFADSYAEIDFSTGALGRVFVHALSLARRAMTAPGLP
jgi:hypothetical protein